MTGALWPDLHATALIGTGRKPWHGAQPEGRIAALTGPVGPDDADVLLAAGAVTVARRAGAAPNRAAEPITPAPAEDREQVPPPAANRLRTLLAGTTDVDLLAVWLRLAAERSLIAPADCLPALFQLARVQHQIRPLAVPVVGRRGAWLAAQRPEWRFVLDGQARQVTVPDQRLWEEGSLAERVAYLAALRDQDPAAGRQHLADVWPTEPPPERAALLPALANGLSLDDEEFCEAALGDRRKEVRVAAAELLAQVSGSAYHDRMAARIRAWVAMDRRRVSVRPPEECDAAMRRDGIEAKPPPGTGERAWWLEQVAAAAPLSVWSGIAPTPAGAVAARIETGWAPTLRRAWARAAVRSRDAEWAAALIADGFGAGADAEVHDAALAASLYQLLPADALIAATVELAAAGAGADLTRLGRLLDACPVPWPPQLASSLLDFLHRAVRDAHPSWVPGRLQAIAQTIVGGLALEALPAVATLAEQMRVAAERDGHGQTAAVRLMDSAVSSISVRYTMFQEFE